MKYQTEQRIYHVSAIGEVPQKVGSGDYFLRAELW
jgi:hypothetical protein